MTPPTSQTTKSIGFLDLPGELRNCIYLHRIKWATSFISVKGYRMRYQMLIPLLLANHEIAGEARPLLLAENGIHLIPQKVPFNGLPEDGTWRIIDVPPSKFRPLIKRAKLTLSVPRDLLLTTNKDSSIIVGGDGIVRHDIRGVLWLEPLRTLTQLGFALDELVIDAEYTRDTQCVLKKDGELVS
jgi:hypothetical protein